MTFQIRFCRVLTLAIAIVAYLPFQSAWADPPASCEQTEDSCYDNAPMITYCESEGDLDGDGEDEMMCSEEPDGNFLQDCLDRLYEAWEACEEFYESMAPEPIPDPIPDSDIDPSTLPVELDET